MNYNLYDNQDLINFFNKIFQDEELTIVAPNIMKFFIITRNYGLINYRDNLQKIINGENLNNLIIDTIKEGFQKDNITFDDKNLVTLLVNNYHENGFYFHSFPGIYRESIEGNDILVNNLNNSDKKYNEIIDKYHIGEYFKKLDNRILVSEKLDIPHTIESALLAPEWLNIFLKQGNRDINSIFASGNILELKPLIDNALNYFKVRMEGNPQYDENDYMFLCSYISDEVNKRFIRDNNEIGIILIEKNKSDEYFKKHMSSDEIPALVQYIKTRNIKPSETCEVITNVLASGEKTTDRSIPRNLVNIVSYQIKDFEKEHKQIK